MSSCSSFTDVGFAKFSVISFCGNRVFKVNKVCYHFADKVLSCFAYAVIIVKTVVLKIPNGWAVKVTDAPAKRVPMVCPVWKSDKSPILSTACTKYLNTAYLTT